MGSPGPTPHRLTPRQLEVLELMSKGLTNREIANVLGIAAGTAKIHVSAIIEALEVSNRTEAAMVLQDFLADGDGPSRVPGFGSRPALAVLPFDSMTPGEEQEYFCDGLVEDLTTRLAAWRWFPVISRSSAFSFKGKRVDAATLGRELGARYLVEGSARRAGDRVRIHVQLIDASTGEHVFAQQFDRDLGDVFAVQDEVAEALLGALCPALLQFEALQAERRPATSLTSWDRLVRAMMHLARQSRSEIEQAIEALDALCEEEPNLPHAHAARAAAAVLDGIQRIGESQVRTLTPEEAQQSLVAGLGAFAAAERCGRRAVEIDPLDSTAHTALGWGLLLLARPDESRVALERALELNPSSALACFALGVLGLREEHGAEAARLLERAFRLSPRDSLAHHFLGALAGAELLAGDYEAAADAARRSLACEPEGSISYRPALAAALAHLGELDEGRAIFQEVLETSPHFNLEASRVFAPAGLMQRLEEAFERLGVDLQ
ncbi:MAG: LuxR C-terminal-related transcriptional regulator [Myxococcales bacterium]|nr:LuxR C-terminal-related transcriptional regulator [Myxococcales bacterium]